MLLCSGYGLNILVQESDISVRNQLGEGAPRAVHREPPEGGARVFFEGGAAQSRASSPVCREARACRLGTRDQKDVVTGAGGHPGAERLDSRRNPRRSIRSRCGSPARGGDGRTRGASGVAVRVFIITRTAPVLATHLVRQEDRRSRGSPVVVVKPSEHGFGDDGLRDVDSCRWPSRDPLPDSLMGSCLVEILLVLDDKPT